MNPIKEVTFERTYDAPIAAVWQAWTNAEMLKKWWGPKNVDIPECTLDVRVGGKLYLVMEANEGMGEYKGMRWPMEGEYTEGEENRKLAYVAKAWTEGAQAATEIDQTSELILSEENNKTTLKLNVKLTKIAPDTQAAVDGMQYGYTQQFEKLAAFLAQ